MRCRSCGGTTSKVGKTIKVDGLVLRYRKCSCGLKFQTYEMERVRYKHLIRIENIIYERGLSAESS